MLNKRPLLTFIGALTLLLAIVFTGHFAILEYLSTSFSFNDLFVPYSVNYMLAVIITAMLFHWRVKYSDNLGFIYMASSLVKFLIFFIVFNPGYKADGEVTSLEFGFFFIPYALALILETVFLVRILSALDEN